MAQASTSGVRIRGLATAVPARRFHNVDDTVGFPPAEVRKVVAMAGVTERRVAGPDTCSTDLCVAAVDALLGDLAWDRQSIDGLIFVTQTPDYIMPSSSCVLQSRLGLSTTCAAFDVGLGCSGYVYGLWLAASLIRSGGLRRVLLLHGETPTHYAADDDRAVALLFGDAGSATALERDDRADAPAWHFTLGTDGSGAGDLIITAGGFRDRFAADPRAHAVTMNGANVFNFTIAVLPPLIADTLRLAGRTADDVDAFVFHQSNRFIIEHVAGACALPAGKVPLVLDRFGNPGGPSVPLAITQGVPAAADPARTRALTLMLLGYGVGLSWAAGLVVLEPGVPVLHVDCPAAAAP